MYFTMHPRVKILLVAQVPFWIFRPVKKKGRNQVYCVPYYIPQSIGNTPTQKVCFNIYKSRLMHSLSVGNSREMHCYINANTHTHTTDTYVQMHRNRNNRRGKVCIFRCSADLSLSIHTKYYISYNIYLCV